MTTLLTERPAKRPRYQELFEELRDKIEAGSLPPGSQMPTFVELRAREGISRGTVEQAYVRLEREGLIRREQGRGTFVAKRERASTRQIGFIGTSYRLRNTFSYAAHLVEGIEYILERENLGMLLLRDDPSHGLDKVDGILLCSSRPEAITAEIAANIPPNLPCVSLMTPVAGIPAVTADDYGGGQLGARELLNRGHRRVSCLMQYHEPHGRMRTRGVRDALQDAGIHIESTWFHDPEMRFPPEGYRTWGHMAMKNWLANGWLDLGCTAVFAQNDVAAMGVIDAFREAGLRVPEDVSVVGFDGTDLCDFYVPRIAAVQVPHYRIGITGMELLWRQIQTGIREETNTVLPTAFKAGESIGPAPTK